MSKATQAIIAVLVVAVLALGGLLVLRNRGGSEARSAEVVLYAPCGMTGPLNNAIRLFRQAHPEVPLNVVYDNAIVLVRKIRRGDRPDLFISPGELEMRQLVEEGYVAGDSVRDFGTLDLVVFAPKRMKDLATPQDLLGPGVKRVALADPRYNSVGYYGEQALRKLGLWEPLQKKLFLREYPLEAVTLVTNGDVDAGITYLTCPLDTAPEKANKSNVRIVAKIPRDAYPPVRCQVGRLKESKQVARSQVFIDFITSEEVQKAIAIEGLLPAKEIR